MTEQESADRGERALDLSAKNIVVTTAPVLFGLLLEQLIGMTDAIFLGRYGEVELGAAGLGSVVFIFFIAQAFGYGVGVQSLMARAHGAGRDRETGAIFRQGALFLLWAGVLSGAICVFLSDAFMLAAAKSEAVQRAAADYVFWRGLGLPFAFLGVIFRSLFVAVLKTSVITWCSIIMVGTNCLLNGLLIFGWGPVPALGISGAAIASALAELAALGYLAWAAKSAGIWARCAISGPLVWDAPMQKRLLSLGKWLFLQEAVMVGVWFYFFAAVEHVSDRALAASNVVRQLGSLLLFFIHAFGTTCGSMAANLYGAGRRDEINALCRRGFALAFCAMLPAAALFWLFPMPVLRFFTNVDAVAAAAKPAYFVMIASYVVTAAAYYYYFVAGALGFAKPSFVICAWASVIYGLYVAAVVSLTEDLAVIWTADAVFGILLGIGFLLLWRRTEWSRTRGRCAPILPQGEAPD